uniref:Uncharacterized protein n=1 Tax=Hordeum vulgare subsp. vulgare TaxID=112509 RepID=A0A8I6XVY5_HORVV
MAPPAYGYPDGGELPPFVLIDPCAYFIDRDNATTAVCEMEGPSLTGRLKVTFCAVAPPLVSYFYVHTSHMDLTDLNTTPYILATETDGGLVLLCVATGNHHTDHWYPRNRHYFVYDALSRKLDQLPGFQHKLNEPSLAIMRKPNKSSKNTTNHNDLTLRSHHFALHPHPHGEAEMEADRHFALRPHGHGEAEMEADRHFALRPHGHGEAEMEADRHFALRPHGHGEAEADRHFALCPHGHGEAEAEADHFVVAAQAYLFWGEKSPNLCIYDSATKTWSNKPVVMGSYTGTHLTNKTLTIGGSNGTIAWVDLWRNIVFYDVLAKLYR